MDSEDYGSVVEGFCYRCVCPLFLGHSGVFGFGFLDVGVGSAGSAGIGSRQEVMRRARMIICFSF